MELMEGFKQTELGPICSDWTIVEFQEVIDGFSSGQTPYRGNPEFYRGDIPWITSGELNYNIVVDTKEKITPEGMKEANLKKIPKGTFLMAITGLEAAGTRGSCAITGIDATTNQSCMALYPKKDKLLTQYLFHYYVRYGDDLAFKFCQGTKQQSYTAGLAKRLPIILPPSLSEQTAIATALSDMDILIAQTEKLIEKKKAIKQGMMQELLKPNDSWQALELGDMIKSTQLGGNYSTTNVDNGLPLIKMGNIQRGKISLDGIEFILNDTPEETNRLTNGDLLFNTRNTLDLVGKVAIWRNELPKAFFNSNLMRIKFKDNLVHNTVFMNALFNTKMVINLLKHLAIGTTSVAAIYNRDLLHLPMQIPGLTEQARIAQIISGMNSEIDLLEEKLEKQNLIKQSMMQSLLTGKIRIYKPYHETATQV